MRQVHAFRELVSREWRYAKFRLSGYSKLSNSRAQWEREYEEGRWDYLGGLSELAHYSVVAGYCAFFESKSILDIGCGHGVLTRMLKTHPYHFYQGVDVSERAIAKAATCYGDDKTNFVSADAALFQPTQRFDTVIFNECLCYFDEPALIVRRYRQYLEPNGRVIVSAYSSGQEREMFRLIGTDSRLLDTVTVTNGLGQRWNVRVFA